MNDSNKKIIIATGGTGGHIFPAVSLTKFLHTEKFYPVLTTDNRGLKYIDKKNIKKIFLIESSPFRIESKFFSIYKILLAIFNSLFFLIKNKPKLIFGMGGYASFPVCFASIILKIPFIIYENNLQMGKANRLLAPFAKKIFVSYEDIEGIKSKHKDKVKIIGNILRENILNYTKINKEDLINRLNILVLGGSQAAKIFAEELPAIFIECKKKNIDIKIYQQCLNEQKLDLQKIYEKNEIDYELFSFTFDVLKYYDQTNLVITRAGSSALAEFLNCNIPIISIPLISSSENHQFKNAQYFMRKGYGFMVEEKDINSKLFDLLHSIHKDKSMLKLIKTNQQKYSDKNVFTILKKEILKIFYED